MLNVLPMVYAFQINKTIQGGECLRTNANVFSTATRDAASQRDSHDCSSTCADSLLGR